MKEKGKLGMQPIKEPPFLWCSVLWESALMVTLFTVDLTTLKILYLSSHSCIAYLCFCPCDIFGINWLLWIWLIIIPFLCRLVFHILISLSSGFTKGLSVILILRYFVFRLLTNRLILSSWLFFCVCVVFFFLAMQPLCSFFFTLSRVKMSCFNK